MDAIRHSHVFRTPGGVACAALLAAACIGGCERKEKVIRIETPGATIDVEKQGGNDLTIDVEKSRKE